LSIKNLENIVRVKMSAMEETAHSYTHVNRVLKIATFLAIKEKAEVELVQIGAILHDIGWIMGQPHNETGAKLAEEILKEIDYPKEKARKLLV